MVLEGYGHPEELKDMVCSPGGTAIYGVQQLEEHGLRNSLICAVAAATKRSKELGDDMKKVQPEDDMYVQSSVVDMDNWHELMKISKKS